MAAGRPGRAIATAAIAFAGSLGLLVGGWWLQGIPLVMGVAGLAIAAGLWRGSDSAEVAALLAGPIAIFPGLFGAYGLKTTAETWLEACSDRGIAAIASAMDAAHSAAIWVLTSYPSDYCERTNWLVQWGIGLALTGAGVAGVLLFVVVLATAPRARRRASGSRNGRLMRC